MTATDHRVHGLTEETTAPDWPALEEAEIARVLAGFPDLAGPIRVNWRSPRPWSAAALVQTGAGEVFVKRHHQSVRQPHTLTPEHEFMAHLRRNGMPVPRVLADAHGHSAIARGAWTWEVHTPAQGIDLYRDTVSWAPLTDAGQAQDAGRMLARLHRAAAGFDAPPRETWILVSRDDLLRAPDLIEAVAEQASRRPALAAYLGQRDWRTQLRALLPRHRALQPQLVHQPRLWTHNDWHISNLFWSGRGSQARVRTVLDFGFAGPNFALYDLATAIERNAIAWLHLDRGMDAVFPKTACAIAAGYNDVLPLGTLQRQQLADLLPLVHIGFAVSEVDYAQGITRSTENADVAWQTFLLGHAAWFDTPPGQALLRAIRGDG